LDVVSDAEKQQQHVGNTQLVAARGCGVIAAGDRHDIHGDHGTEWLDPHASGSHGLTASRPPRNLRLRPRHRAQSPSLCPPGNAVVCVGNGSGW